MLKYMFYSYLVFLLSVSIHEIGHLFGVILYRLKEYEVRIGRKYYIMNNVRFKFSLVPTSGSVKMSYDELEEKGSLATIIVFILGPLFSVTLLILSLQIGNIIVRYMSVIINFSIAFVSLLPFIPGSDLYNVIKLVKKQKQSKVK